MAEINQVDILVKADVPAIVDNQQLLVYVPVATNSNYGIVKPDGDDLTVENGILKLKEGGSVQQGQLNKKVDKITDSSTLIGDDILKLYAQDNEGQEGYVNGSKDSLEGSVAIRTAEGTLKSQRAQEDWDLVPLKQVEEIAQANDTPGAITDATVDANIGQNAIVHKSIEKWTYNETGNSEYVSVDRRIPIIAGKGIKFVKFDNLKAISIYTNLEAKLNENIFKDPTKTYIVWKGNKFPNSDTAQTIFDVGTVIDFGDGGAPTVITEAWTNIKVNHTYFDNTDYHIITITYPDTNARAIRANRYNGCTGLIYILTSGYITSIEEGAFSNCGKLDYLYLPNVNTIGNYAFQGMGTILDIDMPAVTSIGEYCFQGNEYSKHIVFPKLHTISVGALQIFEDVELGPDLEAVTIIKQFALNNCKVLTISDEKQTVLAEQNAFSDKLKRIYVPKSKYSTYTSDWVAYYDKIAYKIDSYDLFLELGKCIPDTEKGEANGVATLDASGKVPSSQLPSYVDDVIDSYIVGNTPFAADWLSLTAGGAPLTPEEGKIYVIVSEGAYLNNSYRWSGTVYAPVGSPIAVVQQKGQSTEDVMSQKAVTDSLNLLEAKLNENIVQDPSKTYLIWRGNSFPNSINGKFKAPAGSTIDWGDGVVETFTVASTTINTHTYTDGYDYHLITISGLTTIDDDVFRNCIGLTSLTIGNSVTSIGVQVFSGCSKLTSVTIGNGVTSIGGVIFADCSGLTSIMIPDSVTKIGSGAFSGCSGLTSIMIPDSVTKIDSYLFKNCNSLTSIVIPDSVTLIDDSAFLGCYKLTSITLKSATPPTLSSNAIPTTIEKIIVPKSAINAYKAATGWSTYADKIVYEVDSSDLPDTRKFAKLDDGTNEFHSYNAFFTRLDIWGGMGDVDNNTYYFPDKSAVPGKTYTLATTDDVDAKSSFSVEVW